MGEYVERRSDQAFAALVERHIDLVYSTALRSVQDPHLARDIVQKVFILLARRPGSIRNTRVLAGWLYRTTRFTAASTLRTERRRREHEKAAMDLNTLQPDSPSLCQALAPYLDEAMDALDPADQGAVALRFFEGKSLREVGLALGLSDDAAQKRVARAVEKLRSYFARKGLASSSALVASVLAAHAVQAYFKTKQPDLAVQELGEATRKTSFSAYVNQASQAVEEMDHLAGRPALEAKYASTCGAPKPHLAQLKSLAEEMTQVQQRYQNQGDTASVNSLAYMGLALGNRMGAGANNQSIIDQLVGTAIEKKVLGQLDAAGNYDFLGRPVSEVAADLDRQKQSIRQATEFKQQLVPSLNETDLANYLDREKLYGEPEATAWLQTKYGPR